MTQIEKHRPNKLFNYPVTVKSLHVGDVFREWDIWNTCRGLRRIPQRLVGRRIKYIQPRDIFLRPLTVTNEMTFEEWQRWISNPAN